jgi:methylated-DNA-[protein]-cysteine S-methyltransferase
MTNAIYQTRLATPFGEYLLTSNGQALMEVRLSSDPRSVVRSQTSLEDSVLEEAKRQLDAYFAGELELFDLPLAPQGTPYQRHVWQALCEIPFGVTISYAELARRIGRPTACRAVGAANGRNPIAIVIPCHRVIGSDKSLTGYRGGVEIKRWLIRHESTVAGRVEQLPLEMAAKP